MVTYTNTTTPAGSVGATGIAKHPASVEQAVSVLNDLLENSRDGEYGFRACAEEVDSGELKQVFQERAAECAKAATELVGLIRSSAATPRTAARSPVPCTGAGCI
jgi:hypothetical protein